MCESDPMTPEDIRTTANTWLAQHLRRRIHIEFLSEHPDMKDIPDAELVAIHTTINALAHQLADTLDAPDLDLKPGVRLRNPDGEETHVIGPVPGRTVGHWYVSAPNPPFEPRRFIATAEELRIGGYAPVGARVAADADTVRPLGVKAEATVEASG